MVELGLKQHELLKKCFCLEGVPPAVVTKPYQEPSLEERNLRH